MVVYTDMSSTWDDMSSTIELSLSSIFNKKVNGYMNIHVHVANLY